MRKALYSLTLLAIFSCGEKREAVVDQKAVDELRDYEAQNSEELKTQQFIEDYIRTVNTKDWKSKVPKYLAPNPEEFLSQHSAFRESFPNYKSTIKHLVADGNEAIVWMNITANYSVTYNFDDEYIKEVIKGIKAENQELSWDEVWYFDVVDGRFGDKWDFQKDNYAVLKGLKNLN
jgi:predicted ester cyclase